MQETIRLLRALQELDQDLYRVKEELRRLPEERDKRRSSIALEEHERDERRRAMHELETRIKEINDATTMQRQRVRKLETEAGQTADQALIAAFQHEIRSLRRDVSEAEGEGLGLVEKVESLKKEVDAIEAKIAEAEIEFSEFSTNVDKEIADAERRRAELEAERSKRMEGGEARRDVLEHYEKLLDAREGQAICMLDGRICQGCYVEVPSNTYVRLARAQEIVECPSCGRILYLPDM